MTNKKFFHSILRLLLILGTLLCFSSSVAVSSAEDGKYEISFQSRQFVPEPGISRSVERSLAQKGLQVMSEGNDRIHTILQLDDIPTAEEKRELRAQGIELLTYIPNYAWLVSMPAANPAEAANISGVRWVGNYDVEDKLQPELQSTETASWAYDSVSNQIALLVQFYDDVSLSKGASKVNQYGGKVQDVISTLNMLLVHLPKDKVDNLASEDIVEWIELPIAPLEPVNDGNRTRVGVDTLENTPYNLDGSGIDVLVYDGGRVYSHDDLDSKRDYGDSAGYSEHATHVACTILGDGSVNSNYRGMAPNADLLSMGIDWNEKGVFLYTSPVDVEDDLDYAKNSWGPSADLFNASVGTNTAPNGFPCTFEGNYGATSQVVDQIVRGSLGEPFIAAWANGNERGSGRCGTTYNTTAPPACAKNPIHSGATDSIDDSMSSFSSWGPCDDGRIKPTISSPGVNVYSCNDSNSYENKSGTSMASPTTAGVITLMLEQYRDTYSTSGEFLPSTAKALFIHTAVDLGNTGPDFVYGYGRIDGVAAVDAIVNGDFREETISSHGQIDTYTVTVSGSPSELRVSLAWDDPMGSLAALKKLVNNLDLELVDPNGITYYPYILNPSSPSSSATTGVDDLNNQEQVIVSSPMNGDWTVRVIASVVPTAPQDYSLVFSGAGTASKTTTPGSGPPTAPPTVCSEALTNGGFEDGTGSWTWSGSAERSTDYDHSGSYSGRVGGTSDGYFYQEISLPTNFYTGTLIYWVRMETSDLIILSDYFDAEIHDGSNNTLTTLQTLTNGDSSYDGSWEKETFVLDPEYAGRTIRLRYQSDVNATSNTYWYVDDVSFEVCKSTAPAITGLPDQTLSQDGSLDNAIDLWAYTLDDSPDADLTFTIDNSPNSNAGVSIDSNRYIDINPSSGWTGQTNVTIKATDPGALSDTDTFMVTVFPPIPAASFPFCDGFESGSLDVYWEEVTEVEGRVQVSSSYPHDGVYSVLLDDYADNSTYSYASVILTIDLSGQSDVELNFWWRDFSDEDHSDDGVFFSDDGGSNWVLVENFTGDQSTFTNKVIDLSGFASSNGLTLNDQFQIKFQFYDNYSIDTDGIAIDDVCLNSPPNIIVSADSLEQTINTNDQITQTLLISNTGTTNLSFSIQEQNGGFSPALNLDTRSVTSAHGYGEIEIVSPEPLENPLLGWDNPHVAPVLPLDTNPAFNPETWSSAAAMPTARYRLAGATDQGCKLYAIGGLLYDDFPSNSLEIYDPQLNSWTTGASIPHAKGNTNTAVINGVIYMPGGYDGVVLSNHYAYNIAGNSWSSKASLPVALGGGVVEAVNGKLYHMGGFTDSVFTAAVYEYDPGTNSWTTKTSAPDVFAFAGSATAGGYIYVAGGWIDGTTASTRFWRYDPIGDSWTVLSSMDQGRQSPGVVAAGGSVYVFGGGEGWTPLANTEQYNIVAGSWTDRFDIYLNSGRLGMADGLVRGKLWGAGGYSGTVDTINEYQDEGHADNCGGADVPWLSEDPISGVISGNNAQSIDVVFDSTQLANGVYTASLIINSNDPDESTITIPVTMTVSDTNPPYKPSNPSPAHDAEGVSPTPTLTWTGGDPDVGDTVTYDVFLEMGDLSPDVLVCNDVTTTTCDPGFLAMYSDYYWYVVATDNHGASTTGDVWHFTTAAQVYIPLVIKREIITQNLETGTRLLAHLLA